MAFVDYYKILGVDKNIPQKDVQAAYRKRVKQFHPDLHPDDPKAKAKFQALNEAYQVINDPEKRKKYDQYGEHWREAGNFGGQQEAGGWSSGSPFEGFDLAVWAVEVVMASPVSLRTCLEVVVSIAVISLLCREVCNRIWKPLFPSIYTQPCLAAR